MTGMLPTKRATSLAFLLVYLGGQVERSHLKTRAPQSLISTVSRISMSMTIFFFNHYDWPGFNARQFSVGGSFEI